MADQVATLTGSVEFTVDKALGQLKKWDGAMASSAAMSEKATAGIAKSFDHVPGAAQKATSATESTAASTKRAEGAYSSLGRTIAGTAAGMAGFNTAQAVTQTALKGTVGAAMGYERALNVMQATSNATAAEMSAVSARAKALGADNTLAAVSAIDAASAMTELSRAGLSVNNSMAAAKGVLQLATAGQISTADAAKISANALNAFGMSGTEATRVADVAPGQGSR